ncbi:MAG: hypothetical protein A2720_02115 [Candidatus Doudnabacteria bacterium RIFCSPHIGHO2_01_FULL_46_24]|uniref:Uncharacterized protein n=1 Tax=Candidatus Doudnabacteria bacterium RIFCSPHIGHO2_01_FULL_46_24 TaxID=1817825 RepID=A0A1F5NWJ1_9BACT|nr:MAG: hypothetical protein A2720_02115 [Candidatus Doudnabacteria bacterium RIFCSPHIGHO2_01_FULL_46_24]
MVPLELIKQPSLCGAAKTKAGKANRETLHRRVETAKPAAKPFFAEEDKFILISCLAGNQKRAGLIVHMRQSIYLFSINR